ncbi:MULTISPECIES: sulfurtransferase complex subunit TusB [unclassified Pseudomonas]|uniref:sulfurtransferase complex subunit TusB n=1 Tax=unclassified Pseudomonas TaxID=196821 RepID=UPI00075A5918|nr:MULTISPECIES: sulfurtransferase complex subunit TusB [unclassified Pseudomonas]KVV05257.1 sulfur transfer complex subunit TusB [Pseudomonas sp. TAD18]KVV06926.1 sulfur transfer complex subunit TusB [Pseudomonas sp. TAA207]
MSTLHVLNHSPFSDSRFGSCLRVMSTHDALLLCGDAAYALQPHSRAHETLDSMKAELKLFVLDEDLVARNLQCPDWATRVDYPAFVALTIGYDKVNTWL